MQSDHGASDSNRVISSLPSTASRVVGGIIGCVSTTMSVYLRRVRTVPALAHNVLGGLALIFRLRSICAEIYPQIEPELRLPLAWDTLLP